MSPLQPQTFADLEGEGFPETVSKAFIVTTVRVGSVVMSRAPGAAATGLIAAGQDLKGYFVKAKSCNWGPMAGFMCQLPPLNKLGPSNIAFNYLENLDYVKGATARGHQDGYFYTVNPTDNGTGAQPLRSPWVPLVISDGRRQWLIAQGFIDTALTQQDHDLGVIYGLAYNTARTAAVEYVLVPSSDGRSWSLYHGNVYYLDGGGTWRNYWNYVPDPNKPLWAADPQLMPLGTPPTGNIPVPTANPVRATLNGWFTQRFQSSAPWSAKADAWRPINGIQNPFPLAYSDVGHSTGAVESPLNAVVGDYDLFGVWPRLAPDIIPELMRWTERTLPAPPPPARPLFTTVPRKAFTVRSMISENILVECVPSDTELAQHPSLGNINSLVALTAGTLNSNAAYLPRFLSRPLDPNQVRTNPNRAFHSDDGGRPDIWRVEMPVGVFLPPGLDTEIGFPAQTGMLMLRGALDFSRLIEACMERCVVSLERRMAGVHVRPVQRSDDPRRARRGREPDHGRRLRRGRQGAARSPAGGSGRAR